MAIGASAASAMTLTKTAATAIARCLKPRIIRMGRSRISLRRRSPRVPEHACIVTVQLSPIARGEPILSIAREMALFHQNAIR